jgi:putative membrane protein
LRITLGKELDLMMWWGYGNMGWAWGYGLLVLAGVAVLIYVVIRLVMNTSESADARPSSTDVGPSNAKRILEERFARGELTADQYREQRRVLDESQ